VTNALSTQEADNVPFVVEDIEPSHHWNVTKQGMTPMMQVSQILCNQRVLTQNVIFSLNKVTNLTRTVTSKRELWPKRLIFG
jgi:hypothetical protein